MNKIQYLLTLLLLCLSIGIGRCQANGYHFTSAKQVRNYFASNITHLETIEGEYDVQLSYRTDSPFQRDGSLSDSYLIVKNPISQKLQIFCEDENGFNEIGNPSIEQIGSTNAFRLNWGSSSDRAILENGVRLRASLELNSQDAKKFAGNSRYSYRIILDYDMIKKYPTAEMYANGSEEYENEAKTGKWTGTGFSLLDNYIVTNYHVVDGAQNISILGVNGIHNKTYEAEVIATDKVNDLAIIRVKGVSIPSAGIPYSVKTKVSDVGENVFVLGYPLTSTMGDEIKLTTGVISSRSGYQGDLSLYQISAPIQPGNSGGPLFDSNGNVIGIVSAKHIGAENVSYAIKTSYLKNLIEHSISSKVYPVSNKLANLNLAAKVKAIKNYVYYIICSGKDKEEKDSKTTDTNRPSPLTDYQRYIYAAQDGDPEAQFRIGACFSEGSGVTKDMKKAAYWWQLGANQGDPSCQYNLGLCYLKGEGVTINKNKGAELIKSAAQDGMPAAQSKMGALYRDGIGVISDIQNAVYWWQQAAAQDYPDAQVNLGVCYANGWGVDKNLSTAKYWWEKAATKGDKVAISNLSKLEIAHEDVENDKPTESSLCSQNIFQKNIDAAKEGNADAEYIIGRCYHRGECVEKNDSLAFEWYQKSANKGNTKAQTCLGACYELGLGVKQNYPLAVMWYKKAAEQGNSKAQTCLGYCYGKGLGVTNDYSQAIEWWRKAARQGDSEAQNCMGNCYNYGTGVSKDITQAFFWYSKSAKQGYAESQFMLGVYYSTGLGVQSNASEAASWWLKAAHQGNADAQYMIGLCYENGEGVEQDLDKSKYWYSKAAQQGHIDAQKKLK